jgi:hypothetical protein
VPSPTPFGGRLLICQAFTDVFYVTHFQLEYVSHLWYALHMSKLQKRPQAQKEYVEHVQNLRRGSTTSRHRSPRDYRRKPKHVSKGWE